jgi:hypothetical protein
MGSGMVYHGIPWAIVDDASRRNATMAINKDTQRRDKDMGSPKEVAENNIRCRVAVKVRMVE